MREEEEVAAAGTAWMEASFFFSVPLVAVVFEEPDVEPGVTRVVNLLIFIGEGVP
jgi:arginine exporter protein ArgO